MPEAGYKNVHNIQRKDVYLDSFWGWKSTIGWLHWFDSSEGLMKDSIQMVETQAQENVWRDRESESFRGSLVTTHFCKN
jgi:hypothetical protein